jgi:FkbM family methyltransferase
MKISRKDFLLGLGGAAAGGPLGAVAHRTLTRDPAPGQGTRSFSQSGEDLVVDFLFRYLGISKVTYLDVGAHDPIINNNSYFFYLAGHRGVLVEPNAALCQTLRAVRPRDTTLVAGIGVTAVRQADYYVMSDSSWNSFSKEEAEHQARVTNGRISIQRVVKVPLLDINDVMEEHFQGAPTFVSIDAEGLHLAILQAIDYGRFRPQVICVETLISGTRRSIPEIPAFMETQGYVARGGSFVNAVFVDSRIL